MSLSSLAGLKDDRRSAVGKSGSDAGPVEPVSALKNLVPVEIAGLDVRNRRIRTVVDDLGGTHGNALLAEVDAQALLGADNVGDVHAEGLERVHRSIADGVGGHRGHIVRIHAVVCQRNSHVRFRAAVNSVKAMSLLETLIALRSKAEHDFTKGNDFRH